MPYKDLIKKKNYFRNRYAKDPVFRENIKEYGEKRRKNLEYKEWKKKNQAKWVKTEKGEKYQREYLKKYRENPLNKETKRIYQKEWSKDWNKTMKGKENQKRKNNSPRGRYRSYKSNAKKRNLHFEMTFDQFLYFWDKPCFYCGGERKTHGIDRLNSKKGYTNENIVPCCDKCNFMKQEYLPDEWIEHQEKIVKNKENIILAYKFSQLK